MKEVFSMWRHTNMIVLVALSAAIYAAVLIPFQSIPIIPGHASFRVAGVLPIALGLLFGPAGAWGAAIGNLIGDFFGTLSPGSVGGFVANFMTGFMAYKMWSVLSGRSDLSVALDSFGKLVRFEIVAVTIACAVSLILTWWVCLLLHLVPPQAYLGVVIVNVLLPGAVGGPFVLKLLQPRIRKWGLLWTEIMEPEETSSGMAAKLGLILVFFGAVGGTVLLFWLLFASGIPVERALVRFFPMPFLLMLFVGSAMLGGRNQVEAERHEV